MNKALPIIIVVILLLLGGGAYLVLQNGQGQQSTPGTSTQQGQTQQGNIFTSIKDALSKSLSLECTYKDAKGTETKTYIKSGAVRVDAKVTTAGSEANSQTILKEKKMYAGDPATKKGVVFEIPEESLKTTPSAEQPSGENKGEDFLAEIEKYKDACKTSAVSDSLFVPPSDVEFQDFSKMFQNLPTGASDNGAPPSFDLEQLKKQYAPENE